MKTKPVIVIERADEDIELPSRQTIDCTGYDLAAYCPDGPIKIPAKETRIIRTGLKITVPSSVDMQIRSRSGLSHKGIVVANQPGTIDPDYRDEVMILLYNRSTTTYTVRNRSRIAQAVFTPVLYPKLVGDWEKIPKPQERVGGFGSTDEEEDDKQS